MVEKHSNLLPHVESLRLASGYKSEIATPPIDTYMVGLWVIRKVAVRFCLLRRCKCHVPDGEHLLIVP